MKKGFTLVELLAVIVIISLVVLVAVPRLVKSIKNSNIDTYNNIIGDIVLAANSYANNKDGILVQISVQTLQNEGYLPLNLSNPVDNTLLKGCVYVVDGTSIYKEETCSTYLKGIEPTRIVEINTCELEIGWYKEFTYKGSIEEFEVPCNGTYKLEVWGAGGASGGEGNASKGGYSSGNIVLSHNQKVYICVGSSAGYNGGGAAYGYGSGTGGGATHIALNNDRGILQYYDLYREDIAIVAGGGGGGAGVSSNSCCSDQKKAGGAGGGENGVSANGSGGTQTTGYAFGIGGKGGGFRAGGGGGGWYGGKSCTSASNGVCTGGGGSGYIGGVTDGSTIAGNAAMPKHDGTNGTMTGNTGNGYARITLISY